MDHPKNIVFEFPSSKPDPIECPISEKQTHIYDNPDSTCRQHIERAIECNVALRGAEVKTGKPEVSEQLKS